MSKKVAVFVGSLRKASWNRKLALAIMKIAPASIEMEIVEIGQLPLYNQDLDDEGLPPRAWVIFREQMKNFDAFLFVTPEYNRSFPALLKNAIDVGSRPYGKSIWSGKPCAVMSASPGAMGGFGANHHLRQLFVFLDMPCMQQPEAYISRVDSLFDAEGNIIKPEITKFLSQYIESYINWINQITDHSKK